MFEHTAMLLSFVYALALTHLLSSVTNLILDREQVRFSGLHATWMLIAFLLVFVNWLQIWPLRAIHHWSLFDVSLLFAMAVVQYFTCSLVSIKVERGEPVDMVAFHARQRPALHAAFFALVVLAMVLNYAERDQSAGLDRSAWITEDLLVLPMLVVILLSAFARPTWLRWLSAVAMIGLSIVLLVLFTPLG